ncbi:hypothetical protein ABES25_17390 [Bacillus gobiensis]|uniref:hypothetical protein n=1 Tax=Bacillus gobiensis TaxID=1441095 RepID=UPI003D2275D1
MFELKDMITFLWSFFLILPIVSLIHVAGHSFFAFIFGGKASMEIGLGNLLVKIGPIKVKSMYFIDSLCQYNSLKLDNRLTNALVYAGGAIFNLGTIFLINNLIINNILEPHLFFYQFSYFSAYYTFFALIPVQYSKDNLSDGMAIFKVLKYGERQQATH